MVDLAMNWTLVQPRRTARFAGEPVSVGPSAGPVESVVAVRAAEAPMQKLEHVQVQVVAEMQVRGGIQFNIVSPSGTRSSLLPYRQLDSSSSTLTWTFMSLEFWDEVPVGVWTLETSTLSVASVAVQSWSLVLHGTDSPPLFVPTSAPSSRAPTVLGETFSPTAGPSVPPTTALLALPPTAMPTSATPNAATTLTGASAWGLVAAGLATALLVPGWIV